MTAPASVDEYLAAVPAESRAALEQLRARIRAVAPHATETISYQMPAFRDGDRLLVSYAAFRDHCSLFPMSMAVSETFRDELGTSWNGKGQALAAERWGNYPAVLAVTVAVVAVALAGLTALGREAKGREMTEV